MKGEGMAWLYLLLAGLLEIGWAILLKKTDGFTRLGPSVATFVLYIASIWLLSLALRSLPTSTGYAVWVGSARWARRWSACSSWGSPRACFGSSRSR